MINHQISFTTKLIIAIIGLGVMNLSIDFNLLRLHKSETKVNKIVNLKKQESEVYTGTGFFINDDGYLATAAHVVTDIKGVKQILVRYEGKMYEAQVVAVDMIKDVAIIHINLPEKNKYLLLADATNNEATLLYGFPDPEEMGFYVHNAAQVTKLDPKDTDHIYTDGQVCGGNSGGPLLNLSNDAIGLLNASFTTPDHPVCDDNGILNPIKNVMELANSVNVDTHYDNSKDHHDLNKTDINDTVLLIVEITN